MGYFSCAPERRAPDSRHGPRLRVAFPPPLRHERECRVADAHLNIVIDDHAGHLVYTAASGV